MSKTSPGPPAPHGRRLLGLFIALLLLPWLLSAQHRIPPPSTCQFRLLFQGSLFGGHLGISRHNMTWPKSRWAKSSSWEIASLGLGVQWRDIGVLLKSEAAESHPWGFAGMYAGLAGTPPPYIQVVYGATEERTSWRPALYAYADLDKLRFRRYDEVHIGIGAKWRFYAVSPDLRVSWHRVSSPELVYPPIQNDFIGATLGLELGGLWAVRLD
jgi:hypothetical protein